MIKFDKYLCVDSLLCNVTDADLIKGKIYTILDITSCNNNSSFWNDIDNDIHNVILDNGFTYYSENIKNRLVNIRDLRQSKLERLLQ